MAVKKDIFLEVVSAERTLASCKVDSVELPGTLGRFEVLPDHAPLLSSLAPGEIVFTAGGKTDLFVGPAPVAGSVCCCLRRAGKSRPRCAV